MAYRETPGARGAIRAAGRRSPILVVALLLLAALPGLATLPGLAAAEEGDKTRLFLNLTTDDVWTSQMAFTYANKVLDQGHEVVVFLNVRAVRLAHRDIPQPVYGQRDTTARQDLEALIGRGARVFVCPGCTLQAGMTPDDWIEGVEPGGPALIALQLDPGSKILSY